MKFLLNMNLPRELAKHLADAGHATRHVGNIGLAQASDVTIVQEAQANDEVILTHDLDYGHLLAFSGNRRPSVIIFRLRRVTPHALFSSIVKAWAEIEEPLKKGAIVVLEDSALRVRRLPIAEN